MGMLTDRKTEHVAGLIRQRIGTGAVRLLVVGCGSGLEAAILARELGADVTGIDVQENFDPQAAGIARLQYGDAMAMPFEDGSFDYIYSYHALEHIPDPEKALSEIRRVLRNGGGVWIGTPNRLRMLGYLGSKDATWRDKIRWNLADWKARLTGRFRNRFGAHAGFSAAELERMLKDVFPQVENVTDDYFVTIYGRHRAKLALLRNSGLSRFVYPSIYFMCSK
jgi:ubiquinone/menaquinone biosynthesis C-methylase UbiE